MNKLCFSLIIACISLSSLLTAQNDYSVDVQHFTIEDGLSHRTVEFAYQDKRGFLWFGIRYGLNRFDGYDFKWFTKEKHRLQSNSIQKAYEDHHGRLWIFMDKPKSMPIKIPK